MFYFLIPPAVTAVFALCTQHYSTAANAGTAAACVLIFALLHRRFPLVSNRTAAAIQLFFLLSLLIGKALRGYDTLPAWDFLLHFLSGGILVAVGAGVYRKCGGDAQNQWLLRLFPLVFAIAGAGLWEVYEFALDQLLGMASQNGSLDDTMWDIIAGTASAVLAVFCIKKRPQ